MRVVICLMLLLSLALGQTSDTGPRFEIADVHVAPENTDAPPLLRRFMRVTVLGGRYEIHSASMVELISAAWDSIDEKILGGPGWLEQDRFEVVAKIPSDSDKESLKPMLRNLLEDRFRLRLHKETRPLPVYALVPGRKNLMKEADGKGETGCKPQSAGPAGPPGEGGAGLSRLTMIGQDGKATVLSLGPGGAITFECRNITMTAFAEGLNQMLGGASLGRQKVLDQTGLEGRWNFDVKWSIGFIGPMGGDSRITVQEAVEKQLGLKLEQKQVPTEVLVVDSVERKPTANPPGVAEALPAIPSPTSFEVADVRPSGPPAQGPGRMGDFRVQPGGRVTAQGVPMRTILLRAFPANNFDSLLGVPAWADTERFDITAKAPSSEPGAPPLDLFSIAPLIRSLLVERFGLRYHEEQRPMNAYTLVSARPKMKKADPASRTWCKSPDAPPGAAPGTQVIQCQNATMAMLAEQLRNTAQEINWPVKDGTGIDGGWDFTLTFSRNFPAMMLGAGRGGGPALPGADLAPSADPTGGVTIFQAVEKQLGLKLEMQKRPMPVIAIDHLEQKPTDN